MSFFILKFPANIKLILCYIFEWFWVFFLVMKGFKGQGAMEIKPRNRNLFPFLIHEFLFLRRTYEVLWSLSIWVYAMLHLGEMLFYLLGLGWYSTYSFMFY
ncbi:hypothetical protein AMTRI_Chr10g5910 [Amborella trichopoda]